MELHVNKTGEIPDCPLSPKSRVVDCPFCQHYEGVLMQSNKAAVPYSVRCLFPDTVEQTGSYNGLKATLPPITTS